MDTMELSAGGSGMRTHAGFPSSWKEWSGGISMLGCADATDNCAKLGLIVWGRQKMPGVCAVEHDNTKHGKRRVLDFATDE